MLTIAVVALFVLVWYFGRRIVRAIESPGRQITTDLRDSSRVSSHSEKIEPRPESRGFAKPGPVPGTESARPIAEEAEAAVKDHNVAKELSSVSGQVRELRVQLGRLEDHLVEFSADLYELRAVDSFRFEKSFVQPAPSEELERAVRAAIIGTQATSIRHADAVERAARALLSANTIDPVALMDLIRGKLEEESRRIIRGELGGELLEGHEWE